MTIGLSAPARRLGLVAAACAALAAPDAGQAQGAVTATHGDWQIRCTEAAAGAPSTCALAQAVVAEDRPQISLSIWIWKTAAEGPVLRAIAPLGVALPRGLGLVVDGQSLSPVPFQYCSAEGCVAEVLVDDRLLAILRSGTSALFVFALNAEPTSGIGVPISLNGFAAGFVALAQP